MIDFHLSPTYFRCPADSDFFAVHAILSGYDAGQLQRASNHFRRQLRECSLANLFRFSRRVQCIRIQPQQQLHCPARTAASCSVSLVFSPVAAGQSAATLTVTDDAPGSPQSASISGTAVAAFSVAPASGSSTTASVSAGQSAQYQLQLTPGTGFAGTVSLSCSGAPLGTVCQVPASVSLASGAAKFSVTVTTSGPAQLPPSGKHRIPPILRVPLLALILLPMLFLLLHS